MTNLVFTRNCHKIFLKYSLDIYASFRKKFDLVQDYTGCDNLFRYLVFVSNRIFFIA